MKKFIVHVVVKESDGHFRDVPLRECESYEDAEIARKAYERRNPGSHFLVEHKLGPEESTTNFQEITKSPETLGDFLAALPILAAPWDGAFHRLICSGCGEIDGCDNCKKPERDNPAWWLGLTPGIEEAIV